MAVVVLFALYAAACGGGRDALSPATPQLDPRLAASVRLNRSQIALFTSDTVRLSADVRNAFGEGLPSGNIVWKTLDARVASVSSAGLVTALEPGTTTVAASIDSATATATIQVTRPSYVGGLIASNTVWTKHGGPYVMLSDVQIAETATLTLEPGTVILNPTKHLKRSLAVFGALSARGTDADSIRLQDVAVSTAAAGLPSVGALRSVTFDRVVLNGGHFATGDASSAVITNSSFQGMTGMNVEFFSAGLATIRGCAFRGNAGIRVTLSRGSKAIIEGNYFDAAVPENVPVPYALFVSAIDSTSSLILTRNSFVGPRVGIVLGFVPQGLNAASNYWFTNNETDIRARIIDQSSDLVRQGIVLFKPFLTTPDALAPSR